MIMTRIAPECQAQQINITVFACARDNVGRPMSLLDWPAFVAWLHDRMAVTAAEKKDLVAVGPYTLDGTRGTEAVESVTVGALDIDRDLTDVDALLEALRGTAAVVHGSPRDTPTHRKVRVYAALSRPLRPEECAPFRRAFASLLGVTIDKSTLDPARFFFAGRLTVEPYDTARAFHVVEGAPVDVDLVLSQAPGEASGVQAAPSAPAALDVDDAQVEAAVTAFEPHWTEGERHALALHGGGYMKKRGVPLDTALAIVAQMPDDDRADRERAVRDAYAAPNPAGASKLPVELVEALDEIFPQPKTDAYGDPPDLGAIDSHVEWIELHEEPARPAYLVPELEIGPGRPSASLGASNAGKSIIERSMVVDLGTGDPVFGYFGHGGTPKRVMYFSFEDYKRIEEDFVRLLRAKCTPADFPERLHEFRKHVRAARLRDMNLDNVGFEDWIKRFCERYEPDLVLVDPYAAAAPALDEQTKEIQGPVRALERVGDALNGRTAFRIVHHTPIEKERARGHGALEQAFGPTMLTTKADEGGKALPQHKRRVSPVKVDRYGFAPFEVEIEDLDREGKPWKRSKEAATRNECSWAVRVRHVAWAERAGTAATPEAKHRAQVSAAADRLVRFAGLIPSAWIRTALLRGNAGVKSDVFGDAVHLAVTSGRLHVHDTGKAIEYCYRTPQGPIEREFRKDERATATQLAEARTRLRGGATVDGPR